MLKHVPFCLEVLKHVLFCLEVLKHASFGAFLSKQYVTSRRQAMFVTTSSRLQVTTWRGTPSSQWGQINMSRRDVDAKFCSFYKLVLARSHVNFRAFVSSYKAHKNWYNIYIACKAYVCMYYVSDWMLNYCSCYGNDCSIL